MATKNASAGRRWDLSQFRAIGRALSHRNFRLFFGGQGISLIGTWMTRIATSWLVFRLAPPMKAAFLLGIVGFCGQLPTFLLSPVGGVLVDRWNRHRLLVVTQSISMIQSFGLAAVVYFHQPAMRTIWEILWLNVLQGTINAFDMPGRQAFLIEMVTDKEDLPNAIALNSSLFNAARLIGPSIAGILIALVGEMWCFLIDGVSYLAVIASLLMMQVAKRQRKKQTPNIVNELGEGVRYTLKFSPIRWILIQISVISFMGIAYTVLIPIFADQIQKNSPSVMGFLMGASGVGALIGAIYLASRKSVLGLGRVIVISSIIMGAALMGFAFSKSLWLSLILILVIGLGMIIEIASSNTVIQTIVDEEMRGRVMSLYTMAVVGVTPFGSLFAGWLAKEIGAPVTVAVSGAACILGALVFARRLPEIRQHVHPIYRRMGILPDIAQGLQNATSTTPRL